MPSDVTIKIRGLDKLNAAFAKAPDAVLRNMNFALDFSLRWIQTYARNHHRFRSKTGNVESSIVTHVESRMPPRGFVGLNPSLTATKHSSGLPYSFFIHEGTRAHWIPKDGSWPPPRRKVLRWVGNRGGFAFSSRPVWHPGTKPDRFITAAGIASRQVVIDTFRSRIATSLKEAGLK